MKTCKLILPIGLPGSGKTYLGSQMCNNFSYRHFDADYYFKNGVGLDEILERVKDELEFHENGLYLDGLFTTEKVINKILDLKIDNKMLNIEVIYWSAFDNDRENCIKNDNLRNRDKSSYQTIIGSPKPFCPSENDDRVSKLTIREVKSYDYLDILVDEVDVYDTRSSEYTTGGTYGTCWDEDGPSEYSVDYDDDDYDLLTEYSFRNILKLFDLEVEELSEETIQKCKNIVNEHSDSELDYYGGCREFDYYEYDLKDMIRLILKYQFGITNYTEEEIMEKIPERFL